MKYLLILIMACALFVDMGCKTTTPAKIAVNVSDAAKITAESALRVWNNYIPVGHPSFVQQRAVRVAWQKYQASQVALLDAVAIYKTSKDSAPLNQAATVYSQSVADLINLIRTFGAKI